MSEKIFDAYATVFISLALLISIPGLNANPNVSNQEKFIFTTLYAGMIVGMWFVLGQSVVKFLMNWVIDRLGEAMKAREDAR